MSVSSTPPAADPPGVTVAGADPTPISRGEEALPVCALPDGEAAGLLPLLDAPLFALGGAGVCAGATLCSDPVEVDEAGGVGGAGGYLVAEGAVGSCCGGESWATGPHGNAAIKTRINQ